MVLEDCRVINVIHFKSRNSCSNRQDVIGKDWSDLSTKMAGIRFSLMYGVG